MVNKNRLTRLTQKLIQINSENPPGDEAAIAHFVKDYLKRLGLGVKIYEFAKNRPNVVAFLKSHKNTAKTVLLSPHLDTVPAGRNWKFDPFGGKIHEGKIYGRGATDCKCNLAVSLEAINSIIEDRLPINSNILFAATADEEAGSELGLIPLLGKDILKCDYALILDADEFDIIIAQKGLIHFKVSLSGRKAHGAYPWRGINAINIACSIIQDLINYKFSYHKHPLLREPTINIGTIKGGDKVNMVSDWCEFEVDLRYLPGMEGKKVFSDIKRLIAKRAKNFKIHIDGLQNPYEIRRDHHFVRSLFESLRVYCPRASFKGSEGATVITFFKEKGIPAVASGFGSSGCAHINDEYVRIDNLYRGAQALVHFFLKKGE